MGNDDFSEMNKLTGGILPAATWKKIMLEAEKTETAAALPGIPLDDSYARYAAKEQPQAEVDAAAGAAGPAANTGAAGTGTSGGAATAARAPNTAASKNVNVINGPPVHPRQRQALASANEDDVVVIKSRDTSDPVVGVFRDMFGLFGNSNEPPAKKKRRSGGVQLPPDGDADSESPEMKRLRVRDR